MTKKLIPIIFFGLIFIFFIHRFEGNGDFYHHLNSGKYIVENKALPDLDTYTDTATGKPWVAYSWASGLIYYLVFSTFGQVGINLYSALIALSLFLSLFFLLRSYKIPQKAIFLSLILIIAPIATRWPQRPETIMYPLAVGLLLVDRLRQKYPKLSSLFPLIILIWANFYGSAVLGGLGLLGLFMIKQFIADGFKIKSEQRLFYLLSLITFPLSLLNGYGLRTIFYFFLFIPKVAIYEGEWSGIWAILFRIPSGYLVTYQYFLIIYFLFLSLFLSLAVTLRKQIKSHLFEALLGLAVFIPILAFRQLPLATILATPLLAFSLKNQLKKKWLMGLILILATMMVGLSIWVSPPSLPGQRVDPSEPMIKFAQNNHLSGRAFNMGHWGAYLTYFLYPNVLVYFDTRDDLFSNSQSLTDLYQTYSEGKPLLQLLNKYQLNIVFGDLNTDGINYRSLFYNPDWSIVYFSDGYFIAIPTKTADEKQLTKIDFVDPFSLTGSKAGLEDQTAQYYRSQLKQNPDSPTNRNSLATVLLDQGNFDEAIQVISNEQVDRFSLLGPVQQWDKNISLAEAYLGKDDCGASQNYLEKSANTPRPIIINSNPTQVPSKINKLYAKYYLICQNNSQKASDYLDLFLNQTDVNPLEKAKVRKDFETLIQR